MIDVDVHDHVVNHRPGREEDVHVVGGDGDRREDRRADRDDDRGGVGERGVERLPVAVMGDLELADAGDRDRPALPDRRRGQ